jgi:hypothetical protein
MAGSVMEDICGRKRGAGAFLCAPVTIKVAPIITSEELGRAQKPRSHCAGEIQRAL